MHYYTDVLKKYAVFSGRATRSEFWYFALFNFIISIAINIVAGVSGFKMIGLLGSLYFLAVLIPCLAVTVRRLHDIGKSGWWIILGFIPLIQLVLLVMMIFDSAPDNQYGPNPKGMEGAQVATSPEVAVTTNPEVSSAPETPKEPMV